MTNNNTPLLAAFGMSMGFSADDMHDIIVALRDTTTGNETLPPLDAITNVTKDMDARALFTGSVLYGYLLDAYEGVDVSSILNEEDRE